ncbi:TPA: UDP-N-acetylglucosamine 2-epimerase (hydrolyzing) [Neisseria meningitidis]
MQLNLPRQQCITGTRADFGKLKPLLAYIENHPDLELHLIVTGMHMMKTYGRTYKEVTRENYQHTYLFSNQIQGEPMGAVLGNTITFISRLSDEIEPDMVMIHGDRLEALAGAAVGALSSRLVCHIEGGELSGTVDDSIRHSISKLSHIHLVANEQAVTRLVQMGEKRKHIHIIGSPDLDVMASSTLPSLEEVKEYYGLPYENYGISMFHPVTTEAHLMPQYAAQYFKALELSGQNIISIYPNNDTGTESILQELLKYQSDKFIAFPSIRFEYFLVLLKHAKFMVGNSSAGIREAPLYGVPSIDVGTRQSNRHMGKSIIHTDYETKNIFDAIQQACSLGKFEADDTFNGGDTRTSTERFAEVINNPETWNVSAQKRFIDLNL